MQARKAKWKLDLCGHSRELATQNRHVTSVIRLESFSATTRGIRNVLKYILDGLEHIQQLRRRLGAYTRHTWYIVGGIADQPQIVGDLIGSNPHLLLGTGLVVDDVLHGVPHIDVGIDQLQQILVTADYQNRRMSLLPSLSNQGRNNVIGLVSIQCNTGQTKRIHDFMDIIELRYQALRCRRTVRLIFGIHIYPECGRARVEYDRHILGIDIVQ